MKVLLCLLSGQHVPNLLSVHHYQPDQLVLIETTGMKSGNAARNILEALDLGGLDYAGRHHIETLEVEDDLAAVQRTLKNAYGRFASADWVVNLTGGTKPMSIAAYEFFKALGGKLIYTNVSRPAHFIDMSGGSTEECLHPLGIKEFLAGYGFESRKADDKLREEEERSKQWVPSAITLARYAWEKDILKLNDDERKRARDKGIELSADRFEFPCDELRRIWVGDVPSRKLTKYEVIFLTGGWLEVFVWHVLQSHSSTFGIWDVRLGVEVGRRGDQSGNDFDVSFMHDHGLCMIECKSGSQGHDTGGDVLYKVEAVTRQFRALHVRSCLVTTGTNVLDREGKVKLSLQTRADIYRCRILVQNDIRWLAEHMDDPEAVRTLILGARPIR